MGASEADNRPMGLGMPRSTATLDVTEASARTLDRPWLGVRFSCSGTYLRVYRNADGTRYVATCPRCGSSTTFRVGQGGTGDRFFQVVCRGS